MAMSRPSGGFSLHPEGAQTVPNPIFENKRFPKTVSRVHRGLLHRHPFNYTTALSKFNKGRVWGVEPRNKGGLVRKGRAKGEYYQCASRAIYANKARCVVKKAGNGVLFKGVRGVA